MPQVEKAGGGDSVKQIDHPPPNKDRSSSTHKNTQEWAEKVKKANKEISRDLLAGADITMCMGDDAQGGSGVNMQANTQSLDVIANKLDQMTNLLVQPRPALTGINYTAGQGNC